MRGPCYRTLICRGRGQHFWMSSLAHKAPRRSLPTLFWATMSWMAGLGIGWPRHWFLVSWWPAVWPGASESSSVTWASYTHLRELKDVKGNMHRTGHWVNNCSRPLAPRGINESMNTGYATSSNTRYTCKFPPTKSSFLIRDGVFS